ncbi:MAG: fumarylacetoacetase, partial [Saprospiraceae bacterium]|nr:fumarylacetoacetase [Saprospiraceae bacterium]
MARIRHLIEQEKPSAIEHFNMTPSMNTWKSIIKESEFSLQNLPFGIFSSNRRQPRVGVALGDEIIDLAALHDIGLLGDLEIKKSVLINSSLNDFIGLGRKATTKVRSILQQHLNDPKSELKDYPSLFVQQSNAKMHLPVKIGDYTDFYSSIDHARNVGKLFRDPKNALLPNWRHLPVAYHGRSSSIIVSGEDIIRPKGQVKQDENLSPVFGPTQRLDFELEMGFIIGKDSQMGSSITTAEAEDYIFGLVLVNDWSARDIQKWEYIPLGPFLGKNFATSISPWVIPLESLEPFRANGPKQAPAVLPYLQYKGKRSFDISLEVAIEA